MLLEIAEEKGMSTGLVATSTITHATPASFAAHVDYRKKEHEIAIQYAQQEIDVIFLNTIYNFLFRRANFSQFGIRMSICHFNL